jgi:REP element-mobilizing transposase RayT
MKQWNDSGYPLAYLITFRCYGTWLHGDERGSVDIFHNTYSTPLIAPNKHLNDFLSRKLKREPVSLKTKQRTVVEIAIRETCEIRNWKLLALNIRTNHVHLVVEVGSKNANQVLIAIKANATRQMREKDVWKSSETPWAEKGSKRWLWNEKNIESAIDYVVNGQGDDLPKFD